MQLVLPLGAISRTRINYLWWADVAGAKSPWQIQLDLSLVDLVYDWSLFSAIQWIYTMPGLSNLYTDKSLIHCWYLFCLCLLLCTVCKILCSPFGKQVWVEVCCLFQCSIPSLVTGSAPFIHFNGFGEMFKTLDFSLHYFAKFKLRCDDPNVIPLNFLTCKLPMPMITGKNEHLRMGLE